MHITSRGTGCGGWFLATEAPVVAHTCEGDANARRPRFNSLRKAKDQHKDDEGDKEGEENLRKSHSAASHKNMQINTGFRFKQRYCVGRY